MSQINLGETIPLPSELSFGYAVVLTSNSLYLGRATDRRDVVQPLSAKAGKMQHITHISLLNSRGDILLRISIRPERNEISFNCKAAEQRDWDGRFRTGWPDIYRAFGPNHDKAAIKISEVGERYQIFFNDNYIGPYDKHFGGNAVDIQYQVKNGEPSMFAETMTVDVTFMDSDEDLDRN